MIKTKVVLTVTDWMWLARVTVVWLVPCVYYHLPCSLYFEYIFHFMDGHDVNKAPKMRGGNWLWENLILFF